MLCSILQNNQGHERGTRMRASIDETRSSVISISQRRTGNRSRGGAHHAQKRGRQLHRLAVIRVVVSLSSTTSITAGDLIAGVRLVIVIVARVDDPPSKPLVVRFQQLVYLRLSKRHIHIPIPTRWRSGVSPSRRTNGGACLCLR